MWRSETAFTARSRTIFGEPGVYLPWGSACNAGDPGSIPGSGRSPGGGNGNPLVFLPRKFHGWRSLVGYSPWGCKQSDTTERLHWFTGVLFSAEDAELRVWGSACVEAPASAVMRSELLAHVRPATGEDFPGTPQRVQNVKSPFKGFLGSLWPRDHTWRTAMRETQVQSLGWEDPLEQKMATHCGILVWRIPLQRSLAGYSQWS